MDDFKRAMSRVQATGKAAYNYSMSSADTAFIDAILRHGVNEPEQQSSSEIEELNKEVDEEDKVEVD